MNEPSFLSDIEDIRRKAREDMKAGAVTSAYGRDVHQAIDLLNKVLASEIVCVLRYKRHYYMAKGLNAEPIAAEFQQHGADEQLHADQVALRVTQLGGEPNFNPDGILGRAISTYDKGEDLIAMIEEDLVAERIAIDSYREMVAFLGNDDSTTRRMLEGILAMEEEHAEDLVSLLAKLPA